MLRHALLLQHQCTITPMSPLLHRKHALETQTVEGTQKSCAVPTRPIDTPERIGSIYIALAVSDAEKAILTPASTPAVLADPEAVGIVESDYLDAVKAGERAPNVRIDAARVRKKVLIDFKNACDRPNQAKIRLPIPARKIYDALDRLNSFPVSFGTCLAWHVMVVIRKATF